MGRWGDGEIGKGELKYLIYIVSVGIGIIIFGVQCELNRPLAKVLFINLLDGLFGLSHKKK